MQINDKGISNIVDEDLKFIIIKHNNFKLEFQNSEKDYRKIKTKELDKFQDKKL